MHKIKEMLHKDSEDSNVSNKDTTKLRKSKDGDEVLSQRQFEEGHIKHGEIEHGHRHSHQHGHTHTHEHSVISKDIDHSHTHSHSHGGEKHIIHEREVLKDGGDLYRSGVDPSLNREVLTTSSHDGGVTRTRVGEGEVVKETVKEVELHKVQPVVHREREQKEIRHVVAPEKQFEVKDTKIHHHERDIDLGVRREASTLETSRDMGMPHYESSREVIAGAKQHQELPLQIEEHVHRKVEEHVHPVIYKEVLKPKVTEETHHLYEKVKEAPIETYEVKELNRSRDMGGLQEAEREFFNRESSRGIVLGEGHSCSRDIGCSEGRCNYNQSGNWTQTTTERTITEPIIGHHQNIGAHHAAGAIPQGHNTAYDAALCNECTDNSVCSHSIRDADRMKKMNEKKLAKDDKLADKQAKKASKSGKTVNVV